MVKIRVRFPNKTQHQVTQVLLFAIPKKTSQTWHRVTPHSTGHCHGTSRLIGTCFELWQGGTDTHGTSAHGRRQFIGITSINVGRQT